MNAVDVVLRAYDDTASAYESAIDNADNYAMRVQSASEQAGSASSAGFGTMAVGATLAAAKLLLVGGAAVGAGYLIYTHFDKIKSAAQSAFQWVGDTAGKFVDWMSTDFATGIKGVAEYLSQAFWTWLDNVSLVVKGIVNALISGDIKLAAGIVWDVLKLAWESGTASILGVWDQMWISVVELAITYAKPLVEIINALMGKLAELATGFFMDDEEAIRRMEKFSAAIIKVQQGIDEARAAGDNELVAQREKRLAELKREQMNEDPEVARAAAAQMAARMTQDFQMKLDKGELVPELQQNAEADRAQRQNEIDKAVADLLNNLNKANKQAGPNAIPDLIDKIKGFFVDGWKDLTAPDTKAPSTALAGLQNERFITGVAARGQDSLAAQALAESKKQTTAFEGLFKWATGQLPGAMKQGVKLGVEAAKGGGVKL